MFDTIESSSKEAFSSRILVEHFLVYQRIISFFYRSLSSRSKFKVFSMDLLLILHPFSAALVDPSFKRLSLFSLSEKLSLKKDPGLNFTRLRLGLDWLVMFFDIKNSEFLLLLLLYILGELLTNVFIFNKLPIKQLKNYLDKIL